MPSRPPTRRLPARRGAAAAELALLLPFLMFLFVIAVDWARVFYDAITVENCARNGALYGADPVAAAQSPYQNIEEATLADASHLSPAPQVSNTSGTDAEGHSYVEVTVEHTFHTITKYPGVPDSVTLKRTVRMRVAPTTPSKTS
jgi:Flp pilus assembly protein TadG